MGSIQMWLDVLLTIMRSALLLFHQLTPTRLPIAPESAHLKIFVQYNFLSCDDWLPRAVLRAYIAGQPACHARTGVEPASGAYEGRFVSIGMLLL